MRRWMEYGMVVPGNRFGVHAAEIAHVGPAIFLRVRIHDFPVEARLGHAHAVGISLNRRKISDHYDEIARILRSPQEGKDARIRVVAIDPFKSVPVEIHLVKGRLIPVDRVQVRRKSLKAAVSIVFEQVPFETGLRVPFSPLAEFAAHEHQFLAGMRDQVPEKQAHVRELLPQVAGHFVDQRGLAVNDLIMGERAARNFP